MIRVKENRYGSLLKAEPYSVKETVLLCLFMPGVTFPAELLFALGLFRGISGSPAAEKA
jgi:hypothetical protein